MGRGWNGKERPAPPAAEPLVAESFYAYTYEWEFACCGVPIRVGEITGVGLGPIVDDRADLADWDALAPGSLTHYVSHHGPDESASKVVLPRRIWGVWSRPRRVGKRIDGWEVHRLRETGSTLPENGSASVVSMPRPPDVAPDDMLTGWILHLKMCRDDDPVEVGAGREPRRGGCGDAR